MPRATLARRFAFFAKSLTSRPISDSRFAHARIGRRTSDSFIRLVFLVPREWVGDAFQRHKNACLVQDISHEAPLRAQTEIQERARRAGRLRADSWTVWYLQACAATFFASV